MPDIHSLGKLGENEGITWLQTGGYKIIARNHRIKGIGEIDVIAKKKGVLHFIEIKTLQIPNRDELSPEDHFTKHKLDRLVKLCQTYLMRYPCEDWEIDLLAICVQGETFDFRLYRNLAPQS